MGRCRIQYSISWKLYYSVIQRFQKLSTITVKERRVIVDHGLEGCGSRQQYSSVTHNAGTVLDGQSTNHAHLSR
jgi:hypothetical protein